MSPTSIARGRRAARPRGAVSVFVAVTLVLLVMALGLVLDLGHLYVAKTEMQNAADACALAAAWEISPYSGTSTARARAAGKAVGSKNRIDFQSDDVLVTDADITFSDTLAGPYGNEVAASTRYVRCAPQGQGGRSVALWIMGLWGDTTSSVTASAIAGVELCAFPLTFCTASPGETDFGFVRGRWYSGRAAPGAATHGNYGWINYTSGGGRDVLDLIAGRGQCGADYPGQMVSIEGITGNRATAAARAFNTRFGLYAGTYRDPELSRPDATGSAYTWYPAQAGSWPPPADRSVCEGTGFDPTTPPTSCNAYSGQHGVGGGQVTQFPVSQGANEAFDTNDVIPQLPGNPRVLLSNELATYGLRDRRLVIVPIVTCANWPTGNQPIDVEGWACGLLTHPIRDSEEVTMEYLGPARNSPCVGRLLPGQANVPVLAR